MTIPQDLQLTINDWYNDREICDDEKFPVFFQRLLNQTFPMYQELLRVQPGYAHYDWLVTMYQEQETKGEDGYNDTSESSKESTNTGTDYSSSTTTTEKSGSVEVADSGADSTASFGYRAAAKDGSEETEHGFDKYKETTDTDENVKYDHIVQTKPGAKIKQTVQYDDGTPDNAESKDVTDTDSKAVAKAAPQSISYAGATAGQIPELDWDYPSSQNQDNGKTTQKYDKHNVTTTTTELLDDTYNEEKWTYNGNPDDPNAGDSTNKHNELKKEGTEKQKTFFTDRVDSESSSGNDSTFYGKTTTTTYKDPKDSSVDSSSSSYGHFADEKETNKTEHKGNSLQRVQSTGRTGTIAGILEEACSFIKGSNAFFWLTGQLDKVFWGIYDL